MVTRCLSLVKVDHELIPGDIVCVALVDIVVFSRFVIGYKPFLHSIWTLVMWLTVKKLFTYIMISNTYAEVIVISQS